MSARLVTVDALVALLATEQPTALLDVRDLVESERGHIPGATILPRRRIELRIDALVRDRATPMVVVDSGLDIGAGAQDTRAALAADTFAALGYTDVAVLDGGVAAWRHAGLTIVSGAQVSSQVFGRRIGDLERVPTIDVATLRRWQDGRRVALCDVRSAAEHTDGCIAGAVSLPGFEVVSHALDMASEADVVVLCSSARTRSLIVARTLIDLGLVDVVGLDGGTLAWQLAGHDLERGSRRRRVQPSAAALQFAALGAARLAKHTGVERIEAEQLETLVAATHANFSAFDLRPGGITAARVPRSVAVDCDGLIVRHEERIALRDAPVVLIDDDSVRALLTGVWLRRLGLPHVQELTGGMAAWIRGGRAVATRPDPPLGWCEASVAAPALDADDAMGWLAANPAAQVLHVDTSASYGRGHLPGSIWLPRGWLETRIAQVAPSPSDALLLTCIDGTQAAFAAATLRRLGHANVAWLQGGTRQWSATGHALESSALPPMADELLPPARRDTQGMRDYLDRESSLAP